LIAITFLLVAHNPNIFCDTRRERANLDQDSRSWQQ
jgi:hypothetical protein